MSLKNETIKNILKESTYQILGKEVGGYLDLLLIGHSCDNGVPKDRINAKRNPVFPKRKIKFYFYNQIWSAFEIFGNSSFPYLRKSNDYVDGTIEMLKWGLFLEKKTVVFLGLEIKQSNYALEANCGIFRNQAIAEYLAKSLVLSILRNGQGWKDGGVSGLRSILFADANMGLELVNDYMGSFGHDSCVEKLKQFWIPLEEAENDAILDDN